jgi:hypothetical protein
VAAQVEVQYRIWCPETKTELWAFDPVEAEWQDMELDQVRRKLDQETARSPYHVESAMPVVQRRTIRTDSTAWTNCTLQEDV